MENEVLLKEIIGALGGYSLSAKISALALDEPAPHGCVGYANLCTCDASARSSPNRALHKAKREISARDSALGGYSLSAKISALALDEQAPHGCVGYANLRTCDASARSSPNRASHR